MLPPSIVAHVDDEAVASEDRIELALPLGDVAAAHRAQVHVADVPVAGFLHRLPSRVAPTRRSGGRLPRRSDGRRRRPGARRAPPPGLTSQQHLLARAGCGAVAPMSATESAGTPLTAVDDVALLDVHVWTRERRDAVGKSGIGPVDVRPRSCRRPPRRVRSVAPSDAGLHSGPRRGAHRPPRTKMCSADSSPPSAHSMSPAPLRSVTRSTSGAYFARHRRPVDAVHVAVVEIVALEPPRLDEHLPPLVARIEAERPVLRAERPTSRSRSAPWRRRRRRRGPSLSAPSASCRRATARSFALRS